MSSRSPRKKHLQLYQNNCDMANKNAILSKQLKSSQKLCQDLWIQHVNDRLRAQKLWKDGWQKGFINSRDVILDAIAARISTMNVEHYAEKATVSSEKFSTAFNIKYPKKLMEFSTIEKLAERVTAEVLEPIQQVVTSQGPPTQEIQPFATLRNSHTPFKTNLRTIYEEEELDTIETQEKENLCLVPTCQEKTYMATMSQKNKVKGKMAKSVVSLR